jgi:hypothetical protein
MSDETEWICCGEIARLDRGSSEQEIVGEAQVSSPASARLRFSNCASTTTNQYYLLYSESWNNRQAPQLQSLMVIIRALQTPPKAFDSPRSDSSVEELQIPRLQKTPRRTGR